MTGVPYCKYSGAGNTFFFIDNRKHFFPISSPLIIDLLKDKDTDGVILIESSETADFRMRLFNPDGKEAEMCGNGLRASVKFMEECGLKKDILWVESGAHKRHRAENLGEEVAVSMGAPKDIRWNLLVTIEGIDYLLHFMNTGVPHVVHFVNSLSSLETFPLDQVGRAIRFHPQFAPAGTNVNIAFIEQPCEIVLRTYERGVERETLACGTGATATALTAAYLHHSESPITIHVRSKEQLTIKFKKTVATSFDEIFLQGPVQKIRDGFFHLTPTP